MVRVCETPHRASHDVTKLLEFAIRGSLTAAGHAKELLAELSSRLEAEAAHGS